MDEHLDSRSLKFGGPCLHEHTYTTWRGEEFHKRCTDCGRTLASGGEGRGPDYPDDDC